MKMIKLAWVAFWLTLAMFGLFIVALLAISALVSVLHVVPGLGWIENWMIFVAVLIGYPHLPERFTAINAPRDIRGSVVIDAPLAEVWDRILPQAGKTHYLNMIKRVEPLGADRVALVYQNPDLEQPLVPLRTHVDVLEPLGHFRLSYDNADDYPSWAADLVTADYHFEDLGGQTRVTMVERLSKIRFSTVLSLLFLNPCKDGLKRAKALCEGTVDRSWMGRLATQVEPNGAGKTELQRNSRTVGFMMCAITTLLFTGMLYGALALATSG